MTELFPDLSRATWRKSHRSSATSDNCVEVAHVDGVVALNGARWYKSTRSNEMGGACVEVADVGPVVAVRDSKDPEGSKLFVRPGGWKDLLGAIKSGAYDQPR
jgi:hypothetical protein